MMRPSLLSCSVQTFTRLTRGRTTRARLPCALALLLAAALMLGVSACATTVTGAQSTSLSGQPTAQATQSTQQGTQPTAQATQPTTQITPTAPPVPPAPPGIQEVSHTETLQGGTGGSVTASCPQGDIALGGGWTIPAQGARVYAAKVNGNS